MNTLEYVLDPALRGVFLPAFVAGLGLVVCTALLSPLVVLRRLAFVGQGVSHAALGGIGLAVLAGLSFSGTGLGSVGFYGVVLAFCVGASLLIARMSARREGGRSEEAATSIGIVLVAAMAVGVIALQLAHARGVRNLPAWESVLFGSIVSVGWVDAAVAWGLAFVVAGVLWWGRRSVVFWAFDEPAAAAFGVRGGLVRDVLFVLLAVTIVVAMKLVGVVLATALLVAPAAAALRLSARLGPVVVLSAAVSFVSLVGGLVLSIEMDLPPGACVVAGLVVAYGVARGVGRV